MSSSIVRPGSGVDVCESYQWLRPAVSEALVRDGVPLRVSNLQRVLLPAGRRSSTVGFLPEH